MKTPDLTRIMEFAADLEAYGQSDTAHALRTALDRVTDAWAEWWNAPLTVKGAHEWGGYSESQLRRLINDRKIPVTTEGKIRRLHVPVQPGHRLPLGIAPEESASSDVVREMVDAHLRRVS